MKRILILTACVLVCSCVKIPKYSPPAAAVTYEFDGGKDMGNLFGFVATYTDKDNKPVQEPIASLPWKKEVVATAPFDAHLEIGFSAKPGFPVQDTYEVGFEAKIEQAGKTKSPQSPMNAGAADDSGKLRFSVELPEGVPAEEVNMSVAPLKYDKHFAFTFTVDDSYEPAWSRIFPVINRKWIDQTEFFHLGCTPTTGYVPETTLAITDGCGNERRFGFGVAIWPTLRDDWHPDGRTSESSTSTTNPYITWEELRIILDFGGFVYFHNVDETKYDKKTPEAIAQGFADDYQKTIEKLDRRMKVLALPDGNKVYIEAAKSFPQIEFTRNSTAPGELIFLNECGSLKGKQTYGGRREQETSKKLDELAEQAASDNPYWVGCTVHRANQEHMDMLTEIYNLYGRAGADNIWVASWDEIYEYVQLRNEASIKKSVQGRTVTFEVTVPRYPNFYFPELSFIVSGTGGDCKVVPLSDNIYGLSHATHDGGGMLVNINFDPQLLIRAEKYTAKYEASGLEMDKDDAEYFVSMLLPELAAPFIARLEHTDPPLVLKSVTINDGATATYTRDVRVSIEAEGTPASYRIGESEDLSGMSWNSYSGSPIGYILSEGYGRKTVYVQLSAGSRTSSTVSAAIEYADVPESGIIGRDAVEAYLKKYDGHVLIVDRKVTGK